MRPVLTIILFAAGLLASGCGSDSTNNPQGAPSYYDEVNRGASGVDQQGETLLITDRTGEKWDVTHAQKYGLVPDGYQYGLGRFAIRPIMDPQMLSPGDPDYPSDNEEFLVLGVSLNGFTRAYPISVMGWHEIANEQFGDAYVAVAY